MLLIGASVLLFIKLFLLRCHVVTNRAPTGRAKHTVVCHMTGNAPDDGAFDAAFRLCWTGRSGNDGKRNGSGCDQYFHTTWSLFMLGL